MVPAFLIPASEVGELSASRPGRFSPGERVAVSIWLSRPHCEKGKNFSVGIRPRVVAHSRTE
jgi:hypothetical protein